MSDTVHQRGSTGLIDRAESFDTEGLPDPLQMIRGWARYLRTQGEHSDGAAASVADAMDEYLSRCYPDSPAGVRIRTHF